jgi:signal peptide peptidase-like protein 2B
VSQALFGPEPPQQYDNEDTRKVLVSPPTNNAFLCQNLDEIKVDRDGTTKSTKGAWMVVPRGGCTYEHKTWIAQSIYEAYGVIVYNTLDSRYSFNTTTTNHDEDNKDGENTTKNNDLNNKNNIVWPKQYHDYDCDNARAEISSNKLRYFSTADEAKSAGGSGTSPYDFETNDRLLTGDTADNLCKIHDPNGLENCPSKRCLVAHRDDKTASTVSTKDTTTVCCAWDILLNPYPDSDIDENVNIQIPTLFATMEQWGILSEAMEMSPSITISAYSRYRPRYNSSAFLIVAFGVAVASYAAFRSADDYHVGISRLRQSKKKDSTSINSSDPDNQEQDSLVPRNNALLAEESLELEPIHALVFLVMSSLSLLVLFYFKIYNIAKVMYAFGCSNAFIQIMVYPFLSKLLHRLQFWRFSRSRTGCFKERPIYHSDDVGSITNWYALAAVIGYFVGLVWLYMSLFVPQAGNKYTFYWVTQDILGFCMCVTFLGIIQLNSIKVASVLMIVGFFYDIFFVFITPYIFGGRSVMVEVATTGGPPKADALWCEKYPSDVDCKGGDPMPMLFSIPRLFDYQGGASMLGLGDIVIPGLLLSFAARVDAARLLCSLSSAGKKSDANNNNPNRSNVESQFDPEHGVPPAAMSTWYALLFGGYGYYFLPLVISYAVGLLMANAAVYLMEMGQPALLYIVPCTLGCMAYKGWQRNDFMLLWNGPKNLKQADRICYEGSPPA